MKLSTQGAMRLAGGAFAAALMCGVASAAMAQDAPIATAPAAAGGSSEIDALKAQIADLTSRINTLEADDATNQVNVNGLLTPTTSVTTATLPNGKPAFVTGDKRFTANVRAVFMMDAAHYDQDQVAPANDSRRSSQSAAVGDHAQDLNDGTNFRRARIGLDGKLFNDWDYSFLYEVGGSGAEDAGHLQEAWIQYSAWKPMNGKVTTKFKLGAFEPNAGLSAATSTGGMPFIERSSPAEIARGVAAGDSRSAFQAQAYGDIGSDSTLAAHWQAVGAVTGGTVSTVNSTGGFASQAFDEQLGYMARVSIAPYTSSGFLLHVGANYQYVVSPADTTGCGTGAACTTGIQLRDRPELRVDGTRLIDTGNINAKNATVYGGELAAQYKNFLAEGEYFKYDISRAGSTLSDPNFHGYYVQGTWVLTGESRAYDNTIGAFAAPKPNNNFAYGADGAMGAWELAARYSDMDLNYHVGQSDGVNGGEQKIASVGINWFPNPTLKFMAEFQNVKVNRLANFNAAATANSPAFIANVTNIGQSYNAVSFRSQLSF